MHLWQQPGCHRCVLQCACVARAPVPFSAEHVPVTMMSRALSIGEWSRRRKHQKRKQCIALDQAAPHLVPANELRDPCCKDNASNCTKPGCVNMWASALGVTHQTSSWSAHTWPTQGGEHANLTCGPAARRQQANRHGAPSTAPASVAQRGYTVIEFQIWLAPPMLPERVQAAEVSLYLLPERQQGEREAFEGCEDAGITISLVVAGDLVPVHLAGVDFVLAVLWPHRAPRLAARRRGQDAASWPPAAHCVRERAHGLLIVK